MTLLKFFGNRYRIREVYLHEYSRHIESRWNIQIKLFGLFWATFISEYTGSNGMSDWYEDYQSLPSAKRALVEELGDEKVSSLLENGKLEIAVRPKLKYGIRIIDDINSNGCQYRIVKGFYHPRGNINIFVFCEALSEYFSNIKECVMKADLKGLTLDNRPDIKNPDKLKHLSLNGDVFVVG